MSDRNIDGERVSGRAETEKRLERAAAELLRRNGVLAGLNLREVADEADVNRGLVYQYFGSRRRLLRSALRSASSEVLSEVNLNNGLGFVARWRSLFLTLRRQSEAVRLLALLVMDGDKIRTMPLRAETDALLAGDAQAGALPSDADIEAVHALLLSAAWGYAIFGTALANEFGVHTDELDARVERFLVQLLSGLAPDETT